MEKIKKLFNAGYLHNYKTILFISFSILVIFGILPSILKSDWTWFGRSGALLVIFGVYVVWIDYKGTIDKSLDTVLNGFDEYLKTLTPEQKKENLINCFKSQNIKYTEEEINKILPTAFLFGQPADEDPYSMNIKNL